MAEELRSDTDGAKAGSSGLLLTLDRGIQVLEHIARGEGRATAKQLTADLGINLGTCYQLLRTLQANGYVHRLPGGRYGLGTRIGFLADHYSSSVAPAPELMDTLHDLHDQLQETVMLAVGHNGNVQIVGVLEGTKTLRVGTFAVGQTTATHANAAAKAFLACADDDALDEYVGADGFAPFTTNTHRSMDTLSADLAATRTRGYAIEREEWTEGVAGLAAPILDEDGRPYGAYATAFPVQRLADHEASIAKPLLSAAERASRFLGYTGSFSPA